MVAHEAGLRTAQQIQAHFTRQGIRIWRDRAEQVGQTVRGVFRRQARPGYPESFGRRSAHCGMRALTIAS